MTVHWRTLLFLGTALAALAIPRAAHAFYVSDAFHTPPNAANEGAGPVSGAPAVYFTGSQRFQLHTCSVCHTNPPGNVRLQITSTPPGLLDAYSPGQTYTVEVKMLDELLGHGQDAYDNTGMPGVTQCDTGALDPGTGEPTSPSCNANEFSLDVTDASGKPAGTLMGSSTTDVSPKDPTAVISLEYQNDPTDWTFTFIAPPAGTGPIVISAAGVDGNGGDGFGHDVTGDDVAARQSVSLEQGAGAPPRVTAGCAARLVPGEGPGPSASLPAAWFALLLAGLARYGRRARVRRRP